MAYYTLVCMAEADTVALPEFISIALQTFAREFVIVDLILHEKEEIS